MTRRRRLRRDAIWREADAEVIAIDHRLTNYFSANSAGALLWKQLTDGATPDELADRLVTTYGIERERAERDVAAFIADLEAQGFLED